MCSIMVSGRMVNEVVGVSSFGQMDQYTRVLVALISLGYWIDDKA